MPANQMIPPKTRRYLSADALFNLLRQRFEAVGDQRESSAVTYPLTDVLMSALSMFVLKDPSLLAFEDRQDDPSLKRIFKIDAVPSDTQMREILDLIDVEHLNEAFADIFYELQRGGVLKSFRFFDGVYLLAIDATGYFSSSKIRCPNCLVEKSKDGKCKYAHQAVAAVLIHPQRSEVIPLAIEPIIKQDGETKNDCERNATKRLLKRIKKQHPKLRLTVTEDGLSSNTPHIADLEELGYHYILGAKPGDHQHLFDQVIDAGEIRFDIQNGIIQADLRVGANVGAAITMEANEELSNRGYCLFGQGFVNDREKAEALIGNGCEDVVHPYLNGRDVTPGQPHLKSLI